MPFAGNCRAKRLEDQTSGARSSEALRSEPAEQFERSKFAVVGGNTLSIIRNEQICEPDRDRFADQGWVLPRTAFSSDSESFPVNYAKDQVTVNEWHSTE